MSHFIRPGNALDKEAASRGTTVYLVDKVKNHILMLKIELYGAAAWENVAIFGMYFREETGRSAYSYSLISFQSWLKKNL